MQVEVFDIETIVDMEGKHRCYCYAYSSRDKVFSYINPIYDKTSYLIVKSILDSLESNKKVIYYVHNLKFDFFVVLKGIKKYTEDIDITYMNNVLYKAVVRYEGKKIEFRCSYALFPQSISKLTNNKEAFPYKLLTMFHKKSYLMKKEYFDSEESFNLFVSKNGVYMSDFRLSLVKYCRNDVKITKEFIEGKINFLKKWGVWEGKSLSLSSLSLNYFFKKNKSTLVKKNINPYISSFVRRAYYGGRTEVFGNPLEGEKILHFDFSGMYAHIMKNYKIPVGEYKYHVVGEYIKGSIEVPGFYEIKFDQESDMPILPCRLDKLVFKNGRSIKGVYWYEEINIGIEEKAISSVYVYSCVTPSSLEVAFKDYMELCERIKKEDKLIGKLLANSLYGRFGIKQEGNVTVLKPLSKKRPIRVDYINGIESYTYKTSIYEAKTIHNVCIAASISSYARIRLYKAFKSVIQSGGRLLYSDTDSIIAAFPKYLNIENKDLGDELVFDLSKPDTEILDAVFVKPKCYGVLTKSGEVIKIKGIKEPSLTLSMMKEHYFLKKDYVESVTNINIGFGVVENHSFEKHISFKDYDKRKWMDNYQTVAETLHESDIKYLNSFIQ